MKMQDFQELIERFKKFFSPLSLFSSPSFSLSTSFIEKKKTMQNLTGEKISFQRYYISEEDKLLFSCRGI